MYTLPNLVDYHHELFSQADLTIEIRDCSQWLKGFGDGSARDYYEKYLALFVCHGVLFENFFTHNHEKRLTEAVVKPAIQNLEQRFGVAPLIVELLPDDSKRWNWYL